MGRETSPAPATTCWSATPDRPAGSTDNSRRRSQKQARSIFHNRQPTPAGYTASMKSEYNGYTAGDNFSAAVITTNSVWAYPTPGRSSTAFDQPRRPRFRKGDLTTFTAPAGTDPRCGHDLHGCHGDLTNTANNAVTFTRKSGKHPARTRRATDSWSIPTDTYRLPCLWHNRTSILGNQAVGVG